MMDLQLDPEDNELSDSEEWFVDSNEILAWIPASYGISSGGLVQLAVAALADEEPLIEQA